MPPTILLSCESISKSYGVKPLFADLSLGLAEGDHVGLIGPNGSGKSTLLKIIGRPRRAGSVAPIDAATSPHWLCPARTVVLRLAHSRGSARQVLIDEGLDPHEHSSRMAKALSLGGFVRVDQSVATRSPEDGRNVWQSRSR